MMGKSTRRPSAARQSVHIGGSGNGCDSQQPAQEHAIAAANYCGGLHWAALSRNRTKAARYVSYAHGARTDDGVGDRSVPDDRAAGGGRSSARDRSIHTAVARQFFSAIVSERGTKTIDFGCRRSASALHAWSAAP